MDELTINAEKRDVLGKKNRFLRRRGITPAHLIGHDIESLTLQCDTVALKKIISRAGATRLVTLNIDGDKTPRSVFVREVQRDPLDRQLFHVDFYQIKKGEKMAVDIPIVLVGESPAMRGKARMLTYGITALSIECLPENVPPQIEVDISVLEELDQAVHVKDIFLDPDITVHADPEQLVVKVSEAFIKPEEEEVVAEVEEGEEVEGEEAPAEGEEAPEQPSAEAESKEE